MAKELKNGNLRLLITIGAILVSGTSAFFLVRARTVANEKATANLAWEIKDTKARAQQESNKLEREGCKQSQENEVQVAVITNTIDDMKEDIEEVKEDVKTFRTEQTVRHTELLKAIREK